MKKIAFLLASAMAVISSACSPEQTQNITPQFKSTHSNVRTGVGLGSTYVSMVRNLGNGDVNCTGGALVCIDETVTNGNYDEIMAFAAQDATRSVFEWTLLDKSHLQINALAYGKLQTEFLENGQLLSSLVDALQKQANNSEASAISNFELPQGQSSLAKSLHFGLFDELLATDQEVAEACAGGGPPSAKPSIRLHDVILIGKAYQVVSVVRPSIANRVDDIIGNALKTAPIEILPNAYQAVSVVRPSLANYIAAMQKELEKAGAKEAAANLEDADALAEKFYVLLLNNPIELDVESFLLGNPNEKEWTLIKEAGILGNFRKLWYDEVMCRRRRKNKKKVEASEVFYCGVNYEGHNTLTLKEDWAVSSSICKELGIKSLTLKAGVYEFAPNDKFLQGTVTVDVITEGSEILSTLEKNTCLACHKVDDRKLAPTFAEIAKRGYSNDELVALIYKPQPQNWEGFEPMPAMEQVSKEDAFQMAAWINSMKE